MIGAGVAWPVQIATPRRSVEVVASEPGCRRLWLVTTNDNIDALRFYQRRGFRLARATRGAARRDERMDLLHHPPRDDFAATMTDEEKAAWSTHFERFDHVRRGTDLVAIRQTWRTNE